MSALVFLRSILTSRRTGQGFWGFGVLGTEFKWDGRDEFGDKLGNGTYLYQVITKKIDGSDYKHFSDPTQNNTDYLFKEGFGKLVIIR